MPTKILINGASGRMGQEAVKAIQNDSELTLVAQTGRADNLAEKIKSSGAEIVIDFTSPQSAFENTLTIINAGAHPVIGTTGIKPEQIKQLQKLAAEKKLGGIIAPNFCIGAVLMMQFAQTAARYYNDVEIIESHHTGKLDAPSGTAVKTAEMIAKNRKAEPERKSIHENITGSRGALYQGVPIHAIRLPGFVASQDVIFGGLGETLSIRHNTINRESFMPGVILACKKVPQLSELVYGLENILLL